MGSNEENESELRSPEDEYDKLEDEDEPPGTDTLSTSSAMLRSGSPGLGWKKTLNSTPYLSEVRVKETSQVEHFRPGIRRFKPSFPSECRYHQKPSRYSSSTFNQ